MDSRRVHTSRPGKALQIQVQRFVRQVSSGGACNKGYLTLTLTKRKIQARTKMCARLGQASAFADARCPTHSLLVAAAVVTGDGTLVVLVDFAIRKLDPKGSDGPSLLGARL